MMKAFIPDRERVLDSTNDLLKTGIYAENLVEVIENTPRNKVFTIGVFGGWGTGKSSIICTAQEKIKKNHKDVKFITYDAWKYANDSFRRMFLLKIQEELKMQQTENMSRFYQSETTEATPKTKVSIKGIIILVIAVLAISIFLIVSPVVSIEWKIGVPTVGTMISILVALLNGCFYDLKISFSKPALFAPEQFEECFKEMMSKCLSNKNWLQKKWAQISSYIQTGESSITGLDQLIIVIDNIDRCPSDMAYQLLTDIKTFLSNEEYSLMFIVPVDDEALKKHLFHKWNKRQDEDINKEKEEFLRKFFNVTLRIKPHQETELQHFAHELNKENSLGYNSDTLAIIAKEFADNPRRIIQLLNNLSGNLALYEEEFATRNETAICVALILQETYPDFYKKVARDLNLIKNEEKIKDSVITRDEERADGTKATSDSLKAFLRISRNIIQRTSFKDLHRIFTNTSSIFSDLPTEILGSVKSYDASSIIDFAKTNEDQRANLVEFIIETLNADVKYGAISQTIQWIEFLGQLYIEELFGEDKFSAIDESLSNFYIEAIPFIEDTDALCYMGNHMNSYGYPSLRDDIVAYITGKTDQNDANVDNVLTGYLQNFKSIQDCNDIAAAVQDYYVVHFINQDIDYSETQKKLLFGDAFILHQIENFTAFDDGNRLKTIIWCIKNNRNLSRGVFTALFDKFIELFGDTRDKDKDDFINLIDSLKPVLSAIETSRLESEPLKLYTLIVEPRNVPHPSHRNAPQFDNQVSILDEIDPDETIKVIDYCYEIMRISGGQIDVSEAISNLIEKNKTVVVEGALNINSLGVSLNSLASVLIELNDYKSLTDLKLLEIILSPAEGGTLKFDDKVIKQKVKDLVDNANIDGVEQLLEKLVSDNRISGMVTEYVASLDSEAINDLPVSISKNAVSTFNTDNADSYKNNPGFLILVLQQGKAAQKKEVIRILKEKMNRETDLENVLRVLNDLVTEDRTNLNSLVSELEVLKNSETVSNDIKPQIQALITKISSSIKRPGITGKWLGKKS